MATPAQGESPKLSLFDVRHAYPTRLPAAYPGEDRVLVHGNKTVVFA
jgi:hypothetical protein